MNSFERARRRVWWAACLVAAVAAALPPARAAEAPVPSFRNDVLPVLTKAGCNSGACHGALAGKNGFRLSLRGYDPLTDHQVLTREALGRRVVKMQPGHSLILLKPTLTIPHAGGKRFAFGSPEYQILADWIAAGAPPPAPDDPVVTSLRVEPAQIRAPKPGQQLQLAVHADYSDGSSKEVTRWAKFSSTADGIASVSNDGMVTTTGHGEAAVTVWYSSRVAFARVTVPFDRKVEESVFSGAPRHNYVDELVLEKLAELNIRPSPLADDHTFLRRMYLDTLGVLPTPEEIEKFGADPDPKKRSRWIDAALERSEYVDYWAYKWSDLLLVSSRKLQRPAMQAYYDWIRDSVARNKPWDEMVFELVTATGSTLRNGAANYWVIHKDPVDTTENLTQSFLGVSLTCARCHNHPMEKWTQDQYYGMANLVSRVSLKDGKIAGDVTVVSSHAGEINHPRLNRAMTPQPLDGEPITADADLDRRMHLARWLTSSNNQAFARTIVNRIWANFMGRGLVEPVDDLRATNPASNERLLSRLADDFVSHDFDTKHLIRTILNSATYQLSSEPNETNADDEVYYSHYALRRLPAEVILDAYSQVTRAPEEFEGYPAGTRALQLPDNTVASYFLDSFGRPARITGAEEERMSKSNVAQVLHLINGETLNKKLRREGNLVDEFVQSGLSGDELVRRVYLTALSRPPTAAEAKRLAAALEQPDREAVSDLIWAVLTSKEFLFKH